MNFTKLATLILAACDWLNVHAGAHCLHVCISCAENFVLDVSGLQTIAFGCFLMFPLSVCIPTHTHPSGIPYDGGHQDTPSLTSHIHHREVCRLPPPRLKSNSKTSPKDLPKWMPMHNLLIKTVTNNWLHHTIQIWCPMSIIKSELAQENTKFWKAVSLEVILYCVWFSFPGYSTIVIVDCEEEWQGLASTVLLNISKHKMAQAHPHLFVQTWFGKHTHVLVSLVATLGASVNDAQKTWATLQNLRILPDIESMSTCFILFILHPLQFASCWSLLEVLYGCLTDCSLVTSDRWYEWPLASTGQLVNVPGTELVGVEARGSRSISDAIDANSMP